jgi:hypothetical protein
MTYTGLKYQGEMETLLDYQYTLKIKGQEGKINPFWGWVPVEVWGY